MNRVGGIRVAFFLIAAALAAHVHAQEHPLVRDHAGTWLTSPPIAPRFSQDVTPAERAGVALWTNALLAVLRRAPLLAPPPGFEVMPHAFASVERLDHSEGKAPAFVIADLGVALAPYERTSGGVEANDRDTAVYVTVKVNDLQPLFGNEIDLHDDQGSFIENPPEPVDTLHGYPVYEQGNGDRWVFIRRNPAAVFAPVTRERYIVAKLASVDAQIAEIVRRRAALPPGMPPAILAAIDDETASMRRLATNTRQAYAAMSASDRRAPAIVGDSGQEGAPKFAASADEGTPILCFNPALMDSKLPRAAPQILAVSIGGKDDILPGGAARLDGEIDWPALEKLLHQ